MNKLCYLCHGHDSCGHLAAEEDDAFYVVLIVLVWRDTRRGFLDRSKVLKACDLFEPFLLSLGEHSLFDEHRFVDAATSSERRIG